MNYNKLAFTVLLSVISLAFISSVYSDPIVPSESQGYVNYFAITVITSEFIAWVIGAEILFRLYGWMKNRETSRTIIYLVMLICMIISYVSGNIIWWLTRTWR